MLKAFDAGRYLIAAGCLYEICAIPHRTPVPTITAIIHRHQKHWAGRIACAIWLTIWVHHFIKPEHYRQRKASLP